MLLAKMAESKKPKPALFRLRSYQVGKSCNRWGLCRALKRALPNVGSLPNMADEMRNPPQPPGSFQGGEDRARAHRISDHAGHKCCPAAHHGPQKYARYGIYRVLERESARRTMEKIYRKAARRRASTPPGVPSIASRSSGYTSLIGVRSRR
jgi:hypothetical protein